MRERKNGDDDYNKTHHVYADPLKLVQEIQNERESTQQDSSKELNVKKKTPKGTKIKSKTKKAKIPNELASTSASVRDVSQIRPQLWPHKLRPAASASANESSVNVNTEPSTSKELSSNNVSTLSASSFVNDGFKSENDDQRNDLTAKKSYPSKSVKKSKQGTSEANIKENDTTAVEVSDVMLDVSRDVSRDDVTSESLPLTSQTKAKSQKQTSKQQEPSSKSEQASEENVRSREPPVRMVCHQSPETGERTCERSTDLSSSSASNLQGTSGDSTNVASSSNHLDPSTSGINTTEVPPSSTSQTTKESPYAELPPRPQSASNATTVSPPEPPPPRTTNARSPGTTADNSSGQPLSRPPDARSVGGSIVVEEKSVSSAEVEVNLGNPALSTTSISNKTVEAILRRRRRRRMLLLLITLFLFFLLVGVAGVAIYLVSLARSKY